MTKSNVTMTDMFGLSKTKKKEAAIRTFLSRFKIPFEMKDDAIDLRTMALNYENGIIPSKDITEAINVILGTPLIPRGSVDSRTLNVPKFAWVNIDKIGINPIFQRDVSPNHIAKIERLFRANTIIVPCAIYDPISGLYLLWDGHHTLRVCDRQGWKEIPVWYIEADISNETSLEDAVKQLVLIAGQNFLIINKTGKRPVSRIDEHFISVECGVTDSVIIQNIVNANGCTVKRTSTKAGEISHVANLYHAYELTQPSTGNKGVYLTRSLSFHRATWPKEEIDGVMMLSMAMLYEQTERQTGMLLPSAFDVEFGQILRKVYGPASCVQDEVGGLRAQYINYFKDISNIPAAVASGLILTYNQHSTQKIKLAQPERTFTVK